METLPRPTCDRKAAGRARGIRLISRRCASVRDAAETRASGRDCEAELLADVISVAFGLVLVALARRQSRLTPARVPHHGTLPPQLTAHEDVRQRGKQPASVGLTPASYRRLDAQLAHCDALQALIDKTPEGPQKRYFEETLARRTRILWGD